MLSLRPIILAAAVISVTAAGGAAKAGTSPRNRAMRVPTAEEYRLKEDPTLRFKVDGARPEQLKVG
jgi:hypothetical protein